MKMGSKVGGSAAFLESSLRLVPWSRLEIFFRHVINRYEQTKATLVQFLLQP